MKYTNIETYSEYQLLGGATNYYYIATMNNIFIIKKSDITSQTIHRVNTIIYGKQQFKLKYNYYELLGKQNGEQLCLLK